MKTGTIILLLIFPYLAISQLDYSHLKVEFSELNIDGINEELIRRIDINELEKIDTNTINLFMEYEYRTRGKYNTHDFFQFFKLGRIELDKGKDLLIYIREGGAGGVNMFIIGLLISDNKYCKHIEIGGLHGDLRFERTITSEFHNSEIIVIRKEFKRNDDETLELESTDRIEINTHKCS